MKVRNKVAVYTAIFGNYDTLKDPLYPEVKEEADFYCFTDNEDLISSTFNIIISHPPHNNPRKNARFYKTYGDAILQNYEYVIWCDGAVQIIAKSLKEILAMLDGHDFGIFKHPDRICAYEESKICMERHLDSPKIIYHQIANYCKRGFPRNYGLLESSAYVKRVNEKTTEFSKRWWKEIDTMSIRDQLSFDYLRWSLQPKVVYFEGTFKTSTFFRSRGHSGKKKGVIRKNIIQKILSRFLKIYKNFKIRIYQKRIDQLAC
ncbi:glycosyltransferase domain-containing protein [Catalinimonas sp. 4WD22]|uniref:glycosyltransferase domain-containing protein n=1 Tax=Catalinimonas locisalis TaxID=3133978 RepID=UPI003101327E